MRIIADSNLRSFWERHPDAEAPLEAWLAVVEKAAWRNPSDVKVAYGNASVLGNSRVCFNIKGNDYRLVVAILYKFRVVMVKFIGTHHE